MSSAVSHNITTSKLCGELALSPYQRRGRRDLLQGARGGKVVLIAELG